MDKRGYNVKQAALYLGFSERVLEEKIAGSYIPIRYINSKRLIDKADLDAFFESLPAERPRKWTPTRY
jgi:hypothetical protein